MSDKLREAILHTISASGRAPGYGYDPSMDFAHALIDLVGAMLDDAPLRDRQQALANFIVMAERFRDGHS